MKHLLPLAASIALVPAAPVLRAKTEYPLTADSKAHNDVSKGEPIVLAAGEKFTPPVPIPLGEGSHATPAVSGGRMYLRTFTHLISVGK